MSLKKRSLLNSRLYVILDKDVLGQKSLRGVLKKIRASCVDIVQLRDKHSERRDVLLRAREIKRSLSDTKKLFIVNDYPDIALLSGADGVHLGQSDISIKDARRLLGYGKIIGISCSNIEQAVIAQKDGADYIGIGPVFPTLTKPEGKPIGLALVKDCKKKIRVPFFAIGGIEEENLRRLKDAGAQRIAVSRAILDSKDLVKKSKRLRVSLK